MSIVFVTVVLLRLASNVQSDHTYIGRFNDGMNRALNGISYDDSSMTIETCYNFCYLYGYQFAGAEFGRECYCDNSYNKYGTGSGDSMTCSGDSSQVCGGNSLVDVYSTSYDLDYLFVFDLIGCFSDSVTSSFRSSTNKNNIIAVGNCIAWCKSNLSGQHKYAGLRNGSECYCSASVPSTSSPVPASYCNKACFTNAGQTCGGNYYTDIYQATETVIMGYKGCYNDDLSSPDLNGYTTTASDMTISACIKICSLSNFLYAGLKNGLTCNCGNAYGRYGRSASPTACNSFCSGNQLQICGGPSSNLIFSTNYSDSIILPFGTTFGDTLTTRTLAITPLGFNFPYFFNTGSYVFLYGDGDIYLSDNTNNGEYQMWPFFVGSVDTSNSYNRLASSSELSIVQYQIRNWSSTYHGSYQASVALVASYITSKIAINSTTIGLNIFQLILTTNGSFSFLIVKYKSIYNTPNRVGFSDARGNPVEFSVHVNGSNCGVPGQYIYELDYAGRSNLYFPIGNSDTYYDPGSTIPFSFTFNYMGKIVNSVKALELGQFYLYFPNGTLATDSLAGYQVSNGFSTLIFAKAVPIDGSKLRLTNTLRNASLATADFTVSSGHIVTWAYHSDYGTNLIQVIFVTNSSTSFILYSYGQIASGSFVCSGYRDSSGQFIELGATAYGSNIGVPSLYAFRTDKDKSMLLDIPDGLFDFSNLTAQQVNAILSSGIDGTNCLVNCSSNGGCYLSNGTLKCSCYKNFTGSSCSSNLDPCTSFPCLNDGTCLTYLSSNISNSSYSYNCSCAGSYSGFNCELKEDLCSNVSCSGHGVCKDWGQTANCTCFSMYTGVNCEKETQEGKKVKAVVATASIVAIIIIVSFYATFVLMDLSNLYKWYKLMFKPQKPRRKIFKPVYTP